MKKLLALLMTLVMVFSMTSTVWASQPAAMDQNALQQLITDGATVTLTNDVTLTSPLLVTAGSSVEVEGNGYTIKFPGSFAFDDAATWTAGSGQGGFRADTSLYVKNVVFENTNGTKNGYAAGTYLNVGNISITMEGCTFKNMWDAVYCNPITDASITGTEVTITGCTFEDTAYSYSFDDAATTGALVGAIKFNLSNNVNEPAAETFAVAEVDSVGYKTLDAAVAAANNGDTVNLLKNAEVSACIPTDENETLTINGNGNTISFNGGAVFNNQPNNHGLSNGAKLIINDVVFNSTNGGYVAVFGPHNSNGASVALDGCTFKGLWCAVYGGDLAEGATASISITNSVYENTANLYSVNPGQESKYAVTFEGNTYTGITQEVFPVDSKVVVVGADGHSAKGYATLTDAMSAAQSGETVKLLADNSEDAVTLKPGVTLDTAGKSLTNKPLVPDEDHKLVEADGKFTVATIEVAKIGDNVYSTLAKAVADAKSGDTIALLADNSEDPITLPEGIKLDTNGKTLTNAPLAPAGCVVLVDDGVWSVTKLPADVDPAKGEVDMAPTQADVTVGESITSEQMDVVTPLTETTTTATFDDDVLEDANVKAATDAIHAEDEDAKIIAVPVIEKEITSVAMNKGTTTTVIGITYEVDASMVLTVNGQPVGDPIDLSNTGSRITFELPVPTEWNGQGVYVVHTYDKNKRPECSRPIAKDGVVKITTRNGLSPFALSLEKPADYPSGGGGGGYTISGHLVTSTLNGIEKVYVDGVLVDSKNYTVSGGDVTLKQSFLDDLKAGTHTVKLIYGDRQATGTFTTKGTGTVQSAKTFDAGIALYAGMAISSAMGAAYVMKKKH